MEICLYLTIFCCDLFYLTQQPKLQKENRIKNQEYLKIRVVGIQQWQILEIARDFSLTTYWRFIYLPRHLIHLVLLRNIPSHKTLANGIKKQFSPSVLNGSVFEYTYIKFILVSSIFLKKTFLTQLFLYAFSLHIFHVI